LKAAFCVNCTDIIAPYRAWRKNPGWRWCVCEHVGVRWRDGEKGLLEVASQDGPEGLRVLGFSNTFLSLGTQHSGTFEEWRQLHEWSCQELDPHYLFHASKRACWALIIRPGETSDVFLIDYDAARGG
jgi:hypothetical protein